MNQTGFKIKISLLAFVSGLFLTWFFMQFSQFTSSSISTSDVTLLWRAPSSFLIYSLPATKFDENPEISVIEVSDKSVIEAGDKYKTIKEIKLHVKNMSRESVEYSGHSLSNVCSYIVKSETQEYKQVCECGTGLERQMLLTGESTTFTAYSEIKDEKVKVGFYLSAKSDEPSQIFWSDEVNLSE